MTQVFVYERHLVGREALVAGEAVMFDLVEDDGRPQARNVRSADNGPRAWTAPLKRQLTRLVERALDPREQCSRFFLSINLCLVLAQGCLRFSV